MWKKKKDDILGGDEINDKFVIRFGWYDENGCQRKEQFLFTNCVILSFSFVVVFHSASGIGKQNVCKICELKFEFSLIIYGYIHD